MKINIQIEGVTQEEAAAVLAAVRSGVAKPAQATPVKEAATATPVKETPAKTPAKTPPKEEAKEAEVVETTRTEEEVTAKAKELVAASSPAVLRGVLDNIIGAGVKISGAPKDKYDAIYDAVAAKVSEINDV